MKQFITLLALIFSLTISANERSIRIVNTTAYDFNFVLLTANDDDNDNYPMYQMDSYMTVPAYGDIIYEDANTIGIPFYLFTQKWYYITQNTTKSVLATTAFADDGLTQRWGNIKYNLTGIPGSSGEIGPYSSSLSSTAGGITVTWIATGTRVTIMIT